MKRNVSIVLLALLALSVLAFKSRTENLKTKLENLSGTYSDPKPYPYGEAWGKRTFTFDKGKWTLVFTLSLDPAMKLKVFEFRTFGRYQLHGKSAKVPDTYEAVFYEDKKFVTLKTTDENLIHAFGFSPCNLSLDVEKDISLNGCSAWQSVKQCPGDYDLLSMDKEGKLYFGERPGDNDLCSPEKRPTRLSPPVVKLN